MKQTEYLDLLRYYLDRFPKSMVDEIICDYEEHFAIGLEHGKTEDEISNELGAPFYVAQEYISGDFDRIHREESRRTSVLEPDGFFAEDEEAEPYYEEPRANKTASECDDPDVLHSFFDRVRYEWNHGQKGKWIVLAIIVLVAFRVLPPLLSFVAGVISLAIALPIAMVLVPFAAGLGAIFGGASLLLQVIGGWSAGPWPFIALHPLTGLFFGLGLIGLGVLLIILSTYAVRFVRDRIMKIVYRARWEWSKRRES